MSHPWPTADGRLIVDYWQTFMGRPPNTVETRALQDFSRYVLDNLPTRDGTVVVDDLVIIRRNLRRYAKKAPRAPARDSNYVLQRLCDLVDNETG